MTSNKQINIQKNKFISENENIMYENETNNEDNEIIINENEDSICYLDEIKNNFNQNNKIKNYSLNNEIKKSNDFLDNKEIINKRNQSEILINKINISNQNQIDLFDNQIENKINNINNNNEINLEQENIKEKKDRINIKSIEKKLFRKNNTNKNINLTYIDKSDKKDICTCLVF